MFNLVANGPSGYNLTNSLRFRSSATAYLSRTFASTGTNNKIQTFSAWVKRGLLSSSTGYRLMGGYNGSANYSTEINFINDNLRVEFGGSVQYELKTTQVFRDPSAWYHIVVAIDTTQATSSNRVKMYVNGNQITAFATANYPAQNDGSQLTSANANNKLGASWSNAEPFDGYMTEINFIDGQALTPSSFGSTNATTGVWQPARYTGTYGTNGFYLKFSNIALTSGSNTGLGQDYSGNGNYWNTNNISVTAGTTYDAMTDVPTLTSATVANYAVWNPLSPTGATCADGNLQATLSTSGKWAVGTFAVSSGKYYFECVLGGGTPELAIGIAPNSATTANSNALHYYSLDGKVYSSNSVVATGATFTSGDIIGVAFEPGGNAYFYKNNTLQATVSMPAGSDWCAETYQTAIKTNTATINFGQRPFSYTPPSGYVALNTYNLPTSTIVQGNKYMDATLWAGNSTTNTSISNAASFKPDFVWIKSRNNSGGTWFHGLYDSVRGVGLELQSNTTSAEITNDTNGYLNAFNSNGFSVTNGGTGYGNVNATGNNYVGWQWQAGQGSTSSNTSGSITSTVSVNASAGFSVVTYTGTGSNATVGHGLGVAPSFIIVKTRLAGQPENWRVYHSSLGGTKNLNLNLTDAVQTSSNRWNNTNPSSTVFSIGNDTGVNESTRNYVAYCWAEIAGFSKFGSYTGNGSTDGPLIYTGFTPKFILIKVSSAINGWLIYDTARNTYNYMDLQLYPNLSNAESQSSTYAIDALSNGFKIRNSNAVDNNNGDTYIYACFASNPFKNSLAR